MNLIINLTTLIATTKEGDKNFRKNRLQTLNKGSASGAAGCGDKKNGFPSKKFAKNNWNELPIQPRAIA